MNGLLLDLTYALRRIRRSPGFALAATVALAVGIGAATAVFGVVNGLFLQPLPGITDQDRLVMLDPGSASSHPNFEDLRESTRALSGVAAFLDELVGVETDAGATSSLGLFVSEDYFHVLGTRPAMGRLLGPGDERSIVLGYRFWERSLGGDPTALGRTLRVNGEPFTLVGIAPEGFVGAFAGFRFDVWLPLGAAPSVASGIDLEARAEGRFQIVGRLAPGTRVEAVRAEMGTLAAGLAAQHGELPKDLRVQVRPFTGFDEDLRAGTVALVGALLALAVLLLLVALANVSGMLLLRGLDRSEETTLRRILGSSTGRSVRPLWIETALISLAGGLLGLLLAGRATAAFEGAVPAFPVPLALDFGLDARVAGFALGLSLLTAVAAGLLPTVRAGRSAPAGGPRGRGAGGGRQATRLRAVFVVCQVGVSVVLLVVAGLFVRSVDVAAGLEAGFELDGVYVAPFVDLALAGASGGAASELRLELLRRISAVPSVEAVAWASTLPLEFRGPASGRVRVEGREPPPGSEGFEVEVRSASAGFFEALGIPLRQGRDFRVGEGRPEAPSEETAEPRDDETPAIVSEALASRLWPGSEALGRRLELDGRPHRVVGVAGDVRRAPATPGPSPLLYLPLADGRPRAALIVRSAGPTSALGPAVRQTAREVAPALPTIDLQPLRSYLALSLLPQRLGALTATTLGGLAVLLSGLGLYGVLAYSIARRRREIGIRVAVGARRRDVIGLAVREGAGLAATGIVVGMAMGVSAGRVLLGLLPGVSPTDPLVLTAACAILLAVAALATALPARRALQVDPAAALRAE